MYTEEFLSTNVHAHKRTLCLCTHILACIEESGDLATLYGELFCYDQQVEKMHHAASQFRCEKGRFAKRKVEESKKNRIAAMSEAKRKKISCENEPE